MNLYIEIENGQPKNHPAFENNLIEAFGFVPMHWEAFVRIEQPIPDMYQVLESDQSVYEKVNGVWTDVWFLRDMTSEEKSAKQQVVLDAFSSRYQAENWSAWTLDEATCTMVPPIPKPDNVDGKVYRWCGADNNWKDSPEKPVDDNKYKFDFLAWQWVVVA